MIFENPFSSCVFLVRERVIENVPFTNTRFGYQEMCLVFDVARLVCKTCAKSD